MADLRDLRFKLKVNEEHTWNMCIKCMAINLAYLAPTDRFSGEMIDPHTTCDACGHAIIGIEVDNS